MADNLVIVESPAKAKTIQKFLGKDYKVMSSYGHIRDLEKKDFSIDVNNGFEPVYVIPEDKEELVEELKKASSKAKTVWLASDEDREGEAIAWHLSQVLELKKENTKRIVFHEITKPAILAAIENPREPRRRPTGAPRARPHRGLRAVARAVEEDQARLECRPCTERGSTPPRRAREGNPRLQERAVLPRGQRAPDWWRRSGALRAQQALRLA